MPYAKSSRRTYKKKASRRHRRRGNRSGASPQNTDVFHTQVCSTMTLSLTQGFTTANYIYGVASSLNQTSGVVNLLQNNEFSLWRNIYDKFRVHSLRLKLVPRYTQSEMFAGIGATENADVTMGHARLYTAIDRDSGIPSDEASILRYSSHKQHKVTDTVNRYLSYKYPKGVWLDAQTTSTNTAILDTLSLKGCIGWYGSAFPEVSGTLLNEEWYTLELTWKLSFMGKAVNVIVKDDGSVELKQTVAGDVLPFSPITDRMNNKATFVADIDTTYDQ